MHALQHTQLPDDLASLLGTLGCLLKTREDRFQLDAVRLQQLAGHAQRGVAADMPKAGVV